MRAVAGPSDHASEEVEQRVEDVDSQDKNCPDEARDRADRAQCKASCMLSPLHGFEVGDSPRERVFETGTQTPYRQIAASCVDLGNSAGFVQAWLFANFVVPTDRASSVASNSRRRLSATALQEGEGNFGMLPVPMSQKSLADYAPIVGDEVLAEIDALSRPLQGARIAHVSATAHGGGVAEMLHTLVPLMRSVGLRAEWYIISGSEAFFNVTKSMHNALQGKELTLTKAMQARYVMTNEQNAASFKDDFDFVVVHDPQPAPLRSLCRHGTWIWRCHIDLTSARPDAWQFIKPFIEQYDAAIFTMPAFVPPDLHMREVAIIPPAIDPLSPKNAVLPADAVANIVAKAGVDPSRRTLVQVSRFDPWKDPLGVIDVFRAVRREIPDSQLVMLGAMAQDDPEGRTYFEQTAAYAGHDPDIHLLTNSGGSVEVNAFQRHAAVILQKSLREGFGLTVTEGLWKFRPVVAGDVGGIPLQIQDGVTGYLIGNTDQCIERVLTVLRDPDGAAQLGYNGHEVVRRKFLSTANLRNYLRLFTELRRNISKFLPSMPTDLNSPS
jgi:trehalose synthase